MKTMKNWVAAAALVAMGASAGAQAAPVLEKRGEVVFDPSTNLEWLANANLAATNTFSVSGIGSNGQMTWTTAQAWIEAMNTANYLGHNDWRLPTALNQDGTGPCSGFNCTGSELGHMFYNNLGGNASESVLDTSGDTPQEIANLLLFGGTQSGNTVTGSSIQPYVYWSGTEAAFSPSNAWFFYNYSGLQSSLGSFRDFDFYAWAVRPGDVTATVPEPQTLALALLALGATGVASRARRR